MTEAERAALETEIRRRYDADDLEGAMHVAIDGYGPELYGFITGLSSNTIHADDAFGATCEKLWKGLPKFRWQSTFRVWAYTIARNEFMRIATAPARREIPVSNIASVQQAIDRVRTTTPMHKRSEVKDEFAAIRAELSPEDHMLLGLRIDRKLAWNEIAEILGDGSPAALRKRFERLKDRLRELISRWDNET